MAQITDKLKRQEEIVNRSVKRWKHRILRYRQKFNAYLAYFVIFAAISIILPFILYYRLETQALIVLVGISLSVVIYVALTKNELFDKMSWMLIILCLPFFGVLLFLFIGRSQLRSRTYSEKKQIDDETTEKYLPFISGFTPNLVTNDKFILDHYYHIAPTASYTIKNKFDFLFGQDVYDRMVEDIKKAKHHIHLEMYIARFDHTTKPLFDALKEKAQSGIKVRYLGDILGHNLLGEKEIEELIYSGIDFVFFNQNGRKYFDHFHVNHRKMLVVDGKVAYTGGYNIGNEYVDGYPKKNLLWYDMMVRITGDVVHAQELMFLQDWSFSQQINLEEILYSNEKDYFPKDVDVIIDEDQPITQFLGDGPDYKGTKIKDTIRFLITHSSKRIYMTTPYLIPSDDILNDLKLAIKAGVDVRIIIPNVPDKKMVYYCTQSYIEGLLQAGARIFEMDGHFVHSKYYLFDEDTSMFGTVNFDMRSFYLNFENNIVQFNDKQTNAEILELYLAAEAKSTEIKLEKWKKRGVFQRIKELFFRAFAPLF